MKIISKGKGAPVKLEGECEWCHCKIECEPVEMCVVRTAGDKAHTKCPQCAELIWLTKVYPNASV